MKRELVFAYPSPIYDDFSVYKESVREDLDLYHVSMEGYIYYNSLQDGIDYLKEIRDFYFQSIKYNVIDDEDCDESIKYRSYDIEIIEDENGIMMFVSAPVLYSEQAVCSWLNGVISQLEIIE